MLKIRQVVPILNFNIKLETYGTQIIGEVPKFALIEIAAPNEIKNIEIKYTI